MTQKIAQEVEMMKVPADIAQIVSLFRQLNVTGPIRDYAEKRVAGGEIVPSLASSAHAQAKMLVDDAKSKGLTDTASGASVGILDSLLKDIQAFAKVAASRTTINKLADKFEKELTK